MTRIAMIALSYYPNDPRIRREAETLTRAGIGVDVICMRGPHESKREAIGDVTVFRVLKGTDKESAIKYVWLSIGFMLSAFLVLQRLFLRHRYKLLHFHNLPDYLVFIGSVQKILGTTIILDLHDLMLELFDSKWGLGERRLLGFAVRFSESVSCRFANHLITTSTGFKERLIQRGVDESKITLVLNSADDFIFANSNHREFKNIKSRARLLYHGTVARRFGLSMALQAVAQLQETVAGATLHIFGKYDPTYRAELEKDIERLGLTKHVILGNYLSLEEISEVIMQADIGIVPYENDSFMKLALSTKTFEYVAMQTPVVASRLPSLTSIFSESCIQYFEPGNVDDLVDKLVEFCSRPGLRERCVRNATKAYRNVSWPIMSERYLNLVQRHLEKTT